MLLTATGLPIIIAVTGIGVERGELASSLAASMVGAGMITVLLSPLIGLLMHARAGHCRRTDPGTVDGEPAPGTET